MTRTKIALMHPNINSTTRKGGLEASTGLLHLRPQTSLHQKPAPLGFCLVGKSVISRFSDAVERVAWAANHGFVTVLALSAWNRHPVHQVGARLQLPFDPRSPK